MGGVYRRGWGNTRNQYRAVREPPLRTKSHENRFVGAHYDAPAMGGFYQGGCGNKRRAVKAQPRPRSPVIIVR
ncbi:MAG: hypothetical protein HXX08_22340 [Chloroflexi bacterium]|uniref:Uncharacterized protein n=1 Tax=Candidatus Chlorohelix allophototropha TaxID=3003348 RepID=A0A8T7M8W3_9CHLR|nr:hypothetical protein [Chloroflexota bacterium]WJW68538.1 hypothetical protein OZ401_004152 [Chloroflexota bacterium L227-S17]